MAKPRPRPTGARLAADIDTHEGRLVYADWLEEQGDPLAATVRLLDEFLAFAQKRAAEVYAHEYPGEDYGRLRVTAGPTYWRVSRHRPSDGFPFIFCFVRKADGAILHAQNWRRPSAAPPRATLRDRDSWGARVTPFGV